MKFRTLTATSMFLGCTLLIVAPPARAWSFYWSKVNVKSSSWQDCMSFAHDAVLSEHLQKIQRNNLEVKGDRKRKQR